MPITKLSIDLKTAERAAEAAASKAREIGIAISIAVVDEAGDLCAFRRMDGAPRLTIDIATNKAYTSASFGMPTHAWWDLIKDDAPLLHGITHTPRLVIFGGGFPIMQDGHKIGAIGISGGHYSQDMECAQAGLDAIGDSSSAMLGKKHA